MQEKAEWQGKYEALKPQLDELSELRAKYAALAAAFAAMSAVAFVNTAEEQKKLEVFMRFYVYLPTSLLMSSCTELQPF